MSRDDIGAQSPETRTNAALNDTINEVIDSMGWDLDGQERDDMHEFAHRLAQRLKASTDQASPASQAMAENGTSDVITAPHINEWFLALEPKRQLILSSGKWLLADAAFVAGFQKGVVAGRQPAAESSSTVDVLRVALEQLAVTEMGETASDAREYELQTKEVARVALRELQARQLAAAGSVAATILEREAAQREELPADIERAVQDMLDLDPYDPRAPLNSRRAFCAILVRAGYHRGGAPKSLPIGGKA